MTMKCEDVIARLYETDEVSAATDPSGLSAHLAACPTCRDVQAAMVALTLERAVEPPPPPAHAWERAMRIAVAERPALAGHMNPQRRGFWLGMGAGSALAASIVLGIVMLYPQWSAPPTTAVPQVTLALHEVRDVSIALDAPEALANAEIRVVLRGAIGLQGYDGQRELAWRTDLDRGVNRLTLPVVANGALGGQLVVEVLHAEKRRTFVVDVKGAGQAAPQAGVSVI
jgi:hypothetical protein